MQPRGSPLWSDQLYVLHAHKGKERGERWDLGGAVIPDVQTATEGYDTIIIELEVC